MVNKIMGKRKEKRFDRVSDAITMKRFVNDYLGTSGVSCDNLRHVGLKSFENPLVIGIDNKIVDKNPEYVKTGKVLIVIDSKGDRGSYINPNLLIDLADKDDLINMKKNLEKIRIKDLRELSKLYNRISKIYEDLSNIQKEEQLLLEVGKSGAVKKLKQLKRY